MIIDCVTYNGEKELFEIRYNILKDFVDLFVVVEFDKTFSGKPKESLFLKDYGVKEKVFYHWHTEDFYNKYRDTASASVNAQGAEHWKREFCQKESIKDALAVSEMEDDDIVFIGDVDEIPDFRVIPVDIDFVVKLKLRVYTYFLNNLSNEEFYGTICGKYKDIKDKCLNHVRSIDATRVNNYLGWHFTSMAHRLEKKLKDSYTEESYATSQVMTNLEENIKQNKDFLGRNFEYKISEEDWPPWLKENRGRYLHLLK